MKLAELFSEQATFDPRFAGLAVRGLAADSRKVRPGDAFVAIPGSKTDGLRFVADAIAAGAVAIVAERPTAVPIPDHVANVRVGDARRALALSASRLFSRQPATIAAITGTSGKTSVAAFARQIWTALGRRAASIGTLGVVSADGEIYGSLTTPDPIELHRTLDRLSAAGTTHAAIEASSHGLDQRRLDGVRVGIGAFTNISRDHLDYHPTVAAYVSAKLRLFSTLVGDRGDAVILADHEGSQAAIEAAKTRGLSVMTVGRRGDDIRLLDVAIDGFSQRLRVDCRGRSLTVRLPLVGLFQVENALLAAGIAIASGEDPASVFAALEGLVGAKGRLELVGRKGAAPVFVDYAHKPDALAKALGALRPFASRRLLVVFGAGGDRDPGKRPIMGVIASENADRVIVTDDNPRGEDPATIRAAIAAGAPGALDIPDRAAAIRHAIGELGPGDVLLIAGKGHETGQIVGGRVIPFSDHEAVAAALRETAG